MAVIVYYISVTMGTSSGADPQFAKRFPPVEPDDTAGTQIDGNVIKVIVVVLTIFIFFIMALYCLRKCQPSMPCCGLCTGGVIRGILLVRNRSTVTQDMQIPITPLAAEHDKVETPFTYPPPVHSSRPLCSGHVSA